MLTLTASAPAAAAESEVREFTIHVDGKHAGYYQMTITSQGDGVSVMSGKADVRRVANQVFVPTNRTEAWIQTKAPAANAPKEGGAQ